MLAAFDDAKSIPAKAQARVKSAVAAQFVVGDPDARAFRGAERAARSEGAAMIVQAMVKLGLTTTIASSTIAAP